MDLVKISRYIDSPVLVEIDDLTPLERTALPNYWLDALMVTLQLEFRGYWTNGMYLGDRYWATLTETLKRIYLMFGCSGLKIGFFFYIKLKWQTGPISTIWVRHR